MATDDLELLRQLETDLWRPESRFDAEFMQRVLAPDFVEVGRSGRLHSRQDVLSLPRQPIPASIPLDAFEVRFIEHEVALVTYISDVAYPSGRERARRSSLWTRATGMWRLRFHQGTPIP